MNYWSSSKATEAFPLVNERGYEPYTAIAETVLLLEDDPTISELVTLVLQDEGYRVLGASNGIDAIRIAQHLSENEVGVLLTDLNVPNTDVNELTGRLSTIHPDIREIFMSGYSYEFLVSSGSLRCGSDFVQKPFSIYSLVDKVREVLDRCANLHKRCSN